MMAFREPLLLLLLLLFPLFLWVYALTPQRRAVVRWSSFLILPRRALSAGRWRLYLVKSLALLSWIFLVISLAGPQEVRRYERRYSEGVDIMIALDVSGSMRSIDDPVAIKASQSQGYFHDREGIMTNRLEYAKNLTAQFLAKRSDDRLGLVVFAGYAVTKSPLTFDHDLLQTILAGVDFDDVEEQLTAIGMAMANALQRLIESKAKSKIMILVTDGANNAGTIEPEMAVEMAKALQVKVYTIGIGSDQPLFPTQKTGYYVRSQTEIEEDALRKIAEDTGGEYYHASDARMLEEIYNRIDSLEKSIIERKYFLDRTEVFQPFVLISLFSLLLSLLLRYLVFRIYPLEGV